MKRAEIIERLQRGEELVLIRLPGESNCYRIGQDRVIEPQFDYLWNYHKITLRNWDTQRYYLYYRWADVPGHAKSNAGLE